MLIVFCFFNANAQLWPAISQPDIAQSNLSELGPEYTDTNTADYPLTTATTKLGIEENAPHFTLIGMGQNEFGNK